MPETVAPITPVMIPDPAKAKMAERVLTDHGIFVRAILPPYVSPETCRIRIIASAVHNDQQMERILTAFADVAGLLNLSS